MARDLAREIEDARQGLAGPEEGKAVHALCGLEEEWA
jgi:hypothetical protein